MKKAGEVIVFVLAFVLAAAAVSFGFNEYRQYSREHEVDNTVKNTVNRLETAARNDASNRTESEKILDASQDMISEKLAGVDAANASNNDMAFAAGVFAGQYSRIVHITFDYCNTLGVDVSEFVDRYKNLHMDMYTRADAVLRKNGSSIDATYNSIKEVVLPYVKQEVSDMRTMYINQTGDNSFTIADSCAYYNQIARDEKLMNLVMFSNIAPEPYRLLMGQN